MLYYIQLYRGRMEAACSHVSHLTLQRIRPLSRLHLHVISQRGVLMQHESVVLITDQRLSLFSMGHFHHVHGKMILGEVLWWVLLIPNLLRDKGTKKWKLFKIYIYSSPSCYYYYLYHHYYYLHFVAVFLFVYIALQLGGIDRVSDVNVILESLQSNHLPFVLLKFCSVLLLKWQARKVTTSQYCQIVIQMLYICMYMYVYLVSNWTLHITNVIILLHYTLKYVFTIHVSYLTSLGW